MSNPQEILMKYIQEDDIKSLKKLFKKNSNLDVNFETRYRIGYSFSKNTPLCYAANRGLYNIVKLLLEHGAEINSVDKLSESALSKASRNSHKKVVRLLLSYGADPLIKNINNKDFIDFADYNIKDIYPERKKVRNYLMHYDVQKALLEKYLDLYHSFKRNGMLDPKIAIEYDFVEKGVDLGLL